MGDALEEVQFGEGINSSRRVSLEKTALGSFVDTPGFEKFKHNYERNQSRRAQRKELTGAPALHSFDSLELRYSPPQMSESLFDEEIQEDSSIVFPPYIQPF